MHRLSYRRIVQRIAVPLAALAIGVGASVPASATVPQSKTYWDYDACAVNVNGADADDSRNVALAGAAQNVNNASFEMVVKGYIFIGGGTVVYDMETGTEAEKQRAKDEWNWENGDGRYVAVTNKWYAFGAPLCTH
ncbi:hypothetical protein [Streptomyces sp. NPDC057675]|uniref:hypothetical protein n=1 Tax=Streptomyces sp. NPDC057675 TaxID=3346204 RepID=UPI0036BA679C